MPFRAFPGVQFPQTDTQEGKRSSTKVGSAVIQAVMEGMGESSLAIKVEKTGGKGWRYGYQKHYKTMVKTMLSDPAKALDGAKAGVEYMHNKFRFVGAKADGSCDWQNECSMQEEMDKFDPSNADLKFIPLGDTGVSMPEDGKLFATTYRAVASAGLCPLPLPPLRLPLRHCALPPVSTAHPCVRSHNAGRPALKRVLAREERAARARWRWAAWLTLVDVPHRDPPPLRCVRRPTSHPLIASHENSNQNPPHIPDPFR